MDRRLPRRVAIDIEGVDADKGRRSRVLREMPVVRVTFEVRSVRQCASHPCERGAPPFKVARSRGRRSMARSGRSAH